MGINQNRETYIQMYALYVFSLVVRKAFFVMIYYDWEVIEVRKRRWSGGQGGICLPFLYNH